MTTATHYFIPQEPGRWEAVAMATAVHVALFTLLWIGIRWQSQTPVTLEAELWSPQTQEAAPIPKPVPPPKPEPAVIEKIKPAIEEPAVAKPDIALEQKKRRKAEEKERLEKLAEKEEQQRLDREKIALAQKNKIKAEKAAAEKKRLQDAEEEKQIQKTRDENLRQMMKNAGSGGSGETQKSQGIRADSSYLQKLSAKIRSHTIFPIPPDLRDNPSVEYTVELFPDGTVRSIKKEHSSQLTGFDEAVERAVRAAAPYPADNSGTIPPSFTFSHKPKNE